MSHRISLSCFLVIIFASLTSAETIGLHCWIVANNEGVSSHSYSSVTNDVIELNKIFAQVAMSFSIQSVTYTNSTHLTNIVFTNDQHIAELCSITNGTGGLEVYFVETISDYANAFRVPSGIAISSTHNRTTMKLAMLVALLTFMNLIERRTLVLLVCLVKPGFLGIGDGIQRTFRRLT